MTAEKTLITADELLDMPDECGRFELIHGELVQMSPAGLRHNVILATLTILIGTHVRSRGLGIVFSGDTGIFLDRNPDHVRAPDVGFIAATRLPAGGVQSGYTEIVPDLVVEVVSPNDRAVTVQQKTDEWLQAGVRLVWVVYPDTRSVEVWLSSDSARLLHEGETLSGAPVLPDFSVSVAEIFR